MIWVRGKTRAIRDKTGRIVYQGFSEDATEERQCRVENVLLQAVREAVWRMHGTGDLSEVLATVQEGLKYAGIPFTSHSFNYIDPALDPSRLCVYDSLYPEQGQESFPEESRTLLRQFWQQGKVVYRRDLHAEDRYGECEIIERMYGRPVRSVVDVPFSHGTLAVNSAQAEAFSERDIAFLKKIAGVLSEGFQRAEDLARVEQHNRDLEEQQRLLTAFHQIGQAILETLDLDQILERLATWIIEAARREVTT